MLGPIDIMLISSQHEENRWYQHGYFLLRVIVASPIQDGGGVMSTSSFR